MRSGQTKERSQWVSANIAEDIDKPDKPIHNYGKI